MSHLILFSNHLNRLYIDEVNPDKVTLLVTKEQFEFVAFHHFRILYHMSAAVHFARKHQIEYVFEDTWAAYFNCLDSNETIIFFEPNDYWMKESLNQATRHLNVSLKKDINFYFKNIEEVIGAPPYKLDPLYRQWRTKFDILMDNKKPVGGHYSYDTKNRQRPPKYLNVQPPLVFEMDPISKGLLNKIKRMFKDHPSSDKPFIYPVTEEDALALLDHFIFYRLPFFGQYQDAMMENEPFMVHSMLSAAINLGLLMAKDVVEKVVQAYYDNLAPIEAVEGFVRQVLGWREYIRGVYLKEMKDNYHLSNALNHMHHKPSFFYSGDTSFHCLSTVIKETVQHGYNHHIQRLMIIGNIANLLQISPQDIRTWFNEMYIDSFDWVVTPNVIGMAQYADGGKMSTKPYIASANYINKMSDYCNGCKYDPKQKTGDKACPVNALYYTFLHNQKSKLIHNPRMKFMYYNYHKLSSSTLDELLKLSNAIMKKEGVHH
jgi:deoxyribodipyrimidine photolyase-related protein